MTIPGSPPPQSLTLELSRLSQSQTHSKKNKRPKLSKTKGYGDLNSLTDTSFNSPSHSGSFARLEELIPSPITGTPNRSPSGKLTRSSTCWTIEGMLSNSPLSRSNSFGKISELGQQMLIKPHVTYTRETYPTLLSTSQQLQKAFPKDLGKRPNPYIHRLIEMILTNEPSQRFIRTEKLSLDPEAINVLRQMPAFKDRKMEKAIRKQSNPRLNKLIQVVCGKMAALAVREEAILERVNGNRNNIFYRQHFGYIDNNGKCIVGFTPGGYKRHNHKISVYNTNLANVEIHDNTSIAHLFVRSGFSNNRAQLLKLLQFAFLNSLKSQNKSGISYERGAETPHFQITLYASQEYHPIRNILNSFLGDEGEHPDEQHHLIKLKKIIDELWSKDSPPLLVKVIRDNGDPCCFFAKKPIIKNFSLSSSADDPLTIAQSRKWSSDASLYELHLLILNNDVCEHPIFKSAFRKLNASHLSNLPFIRKSSIPPFFKQLEEIDPETITDIVGQQIYLALNGLKINITGKDLKNRSFDNADSPGIEFLYHYYLCRLINTSLVVQSEKGCERVGIMSSLILAAEQMLREKNEVLDLNGIFTSTTRATSAAQKYFLREFNGFLEAFNVPIMKLSRGTTALNTKDFPIILRLMKKQLKRRSFHAKSPT